MVELMYYWDGETRIVLFENLAVIGVVEGFAYSIVIGSKVNGASIEPAGDDKKKAISAFKDRVERLLYQGWED